MTHASVFSGIGGSELAASMLGWQNLFHCEINPFGRAVLDYWFPKSKSYEDITTTDFSEWRGRVDVLTGGFPCQPFSYAGKRGGATDDRYLWPYMFRCIDQIQPRWVVAENVAGILTMVEQGEVSKVASQAALFDSPDSLRRQYQLRETFTLQRICEDLEGHGYEVQSVLIPACSVGAPHRRDRVFIVGHSIDADTDSERQRRRCSEDKRERTDSQKHERRVFQRESEGQSGGWTTPDTSDAGTEGMQPEWQDTIHRPELTADTSSERLEGSRGLRIQGDKGRGSTMSDNESSKAAASAGENDAEHVWWDAANTYIDRMERYFWPRIGEQPQSGLSAQELADCYGNLWPSQRWKDFPVVSPVHRGNDGLPFPLDDLTLSPGKWRTEAIKAYGNAIVPQVMYEIFRAIEEVEQNSTTL